MAPLDRFGTLLKELLIPAYCSDLSRSMSGQGFVQESNKVAAMDAKDFLRAWDAGLCIHTGRGQYLIGNGKAKEQFFWEGPKGPQERTFTLWMEPIITAAAIGRLHLDFGWPISLLGAQSSDWAFDIIATRSDLLTVSIAGEVKKAQTEIDRLIGFMVGFGDAPFAPEPESGPARNAFRKVRSLRKTRASLLWLIGPERYEHVFHVRYVNDEKIQFVAAEPANLIFSG